MGVFVLDWKPWQFADHEFVNTLKVKFFSKQENILKAFFTYSKKTKTNKTQQNKQTKKKKPNPPKINPQTQEQNHGLQQLPRKKRKKGELRRKKESLQEGH